MSFPFSSCILSEEILLKIFKMCDVYTLLQLSSVCTQFRQISSEILINKSKSLLITNEMSEIFRERCKPLLFSYNSKFNTYYNWRKKICNIKPVSNIKPVDFPLKDWRNILNTNCLEMTRNTVWFYDCKYLHACNRGEDGNVNEDLLFEISESPLSCITYCNDTIISGHLDGSIRAWRIESHDNNKYIQLRAQHNLHTHDILNIEATTQHIIASSLNLIKIQKNIFEEDGFPEENEIYKDEKLVQSISLDPTGTKLAASVENLFRIYDINEKYFDQTTEEWIDNNTCSQLLWQDPHTILMLYERQIKKLDTRILECVRTWDMVSLLEDQKFYTFSSDNLYTIMTGTEFRTVILWDQRQSNSIEMYHIHFDKECDNNLLNPVVSVQFDSTHMYALTLEESLIELDFKGGNRFNHAKKKEYFSNFC